MWDRKELKAKGKEAYRKNRVMCIIAALLLTVASGAGGATTGSSASNVTKNMNKQDNNVTYNQDAGDDFGYGSGDEIINDLEEDFGFNDDGTIEGDGDFGYKDETGSQSDAGIAAVIAAGIVGVILIIVIIIASLLSIFLMNPLTVGLRKFFTENATDTKASLNKNNIGLAFSDKYMKVVGSMFTTKLFTFLWGLLLIVPGIYKAFQWRMVPFIISENPDITGKEARDQSRAMMDGSKWKAFVMDLSFLGWKLLGGLTLGILNLLFTNPYQDATESELWLHLSGRPTPALALEAAPAAPDSHYYYFQLKP